MTDQTDEDDNDDTRQARTRDNGCAEACMRKAAFRVQSVEVRRDLRLPFLSAFLFVCHAATPDPELVQSLHLYATRDGP
jgi:hypothetical protein